MTQALNLHGATALSHDVAVVGSGPAGLKTALDLADAGLKVLLIESGPDDTGGTAQALSDAELVNESFHAPMALSVRRGLGGTSRLWGGRAVAFDDVDFADRDGLDEARWPITAADIRPWYAAACQFLDCGPDVFAQEWPETVHADGLRLDALERWCAHPDTRRLHGDRVKTHPDITLMLDTTVVKIDVDPVSGMVCGLETKGPAGPSRQSARAYVIAAGGLETTRLLLASRLEHPALFGGPDGALGRFYMGHAFGSIASIQFLKPGDDARFNFYRDASGRYVRRRFTLDQETQMRLGVMNMSAWPELPELHDPRHGNAILSLAYLALATPVLGPRLMAEAIRRRKLGDGPIRPLPHVWNLLKGAPSAALFAIRFLNARYGSKVRIPGFFVLNRAHRYAFHYHSEHAPDADSRVTLGEARDALGMPRLKIDLRFGARDAQSILRFHEALADRLETAGIARIEHELPEDARAQAILDQASDGFHQVGTARMSAEPGRGVVDANARVHGTPNLFLAGSAIFPSSGQANPTLLAVALAARLAARLAAHIRSGIGAL
jgi:choline dehydrogenase-like flavoprotein